MLVKCDEEAGKSCVEHMVQMIVGSEPRKKETIRLIVDQWSILGLSVA